MSTSFFVCVKQALIIIKTRCELLFKFARMRLRYRRILDLRSSYLTSTIKNVKRKYFTQSECILQENSRLLRPSQQMLKHNRSTGGLFTTSKCAQNSGCYVQHIDTVIYGSLYFC